MKEPDSPLLFKDNLDLSSYSAGLLISDLLDKKVCVKLKAKGDSMYPLIKNNYFIKISPWNNLKPGIGDIVACLDGENKKCFIHRIINQKGDDYQLKGDFCFRSDGFFPPDLLIGYVSAIQHPDVMFKTLNLHQPAKKTLAFLSKINILQFFSKVIKKTFDARH